MKFFVVYVIFVLYSMSFGQQKYEVDRIGQKIQIDAFLIEWQKENVRIIKDKAVINWDAMNTSEGLAGYIRYTYKDSSSKLRMKFFPDMSSMHRYTSLEYDTTMSYDSLYAVDRTFQGTDTTLVFEWFIPWEKIAIDSVTGIYEIGFTAETESAEPLNPWIITGKKYQEPQGVIFTPKIIFQIVTIVILLGLFFGLRMRAMRLYRKR